jgi:hypothetical protein
LNKDVLDFHGERGANVRERIDPEADQRAIAQSDIGARIDTIERASRFIRRGAGVLPFFTTCRGPRTDAAGFDPHNLPDDKPIEQAANGSQAP